jgi:putative phosphoribosyl transferase
LFDLLSEEEARDQANARDIELLGVRLLAATRWVRRQPSCAGLQVGYFGAGTDAAVALLAAAEDPTVGAVVSSSGRTDLVGAALTAVFASTLLIVGDADPSAVAINEEASRRLRSAHRLVVVPGATHFLEEPGVLDAVAGYATTWFADHLGGAPQDLGR